MRVVGTWESVSRRSGWDAHEERANCIGRTSSRWNELVNLSLVLQNATRDVLIRFYRV